MAGWGVFELKGDDGSVQELHVIPCDEDGNIAPGHVLDFSCPCISSVEHVGPGCPPLVIHEVAQ